VSEPTRRSRSFSDIGLPDGHAFPKLAYHHPTGTIIAHTRPKNSRSRSRRLSIRRLTESRYRSIDELEPATSVESFVISAMLPVLYYVTYQWSPDGGGDWHGLHRFALDTHDSVVVARPGELVPPEPYRSAWLGDLVSVADDARRLFCIAALTKGDGPIDYWLSELSVHDKRLVPLTRLEAVFA
jgi:hypothetical protein